MQKPWKSALSLMIAFAVVFSLSACAQHPVAKTEMKAKKGAKILENTVTPRTNSNMLNNGTMGSNRSNTSSIYSGNGNYPMNSNAMNYNNRANTVNPMNTVHPMRAMNGLNTTMNTNNLRTAKQILSSTEKVSGVKKATVIVNNKDAVVGLDVKATNQGKKIEKHVYNALHREYPSYKIYVTSDKALNKKIMTAHTDMISAHPVKKFANEVTLIIEDIGHAVTKPFR